MYKIQSCNLFCFIMQLK